MKNSDKDSTDEYEPSLHDLEAQIHRNEAYIFELELVRQHLRSIAMYWYVATNVSIFVAIGLGCLVFVRGRAVDWLVPTTTVEQTIVTSILSLVICAAASSFTKYVSLRRLETEATEVAKANKAAVYDARRIFEKTA